MLKSIAREHILYADFDHTLISGDLGYYIKGRYGLSLLEPRRLIAVHPAQLDNLSPVELGFVEGVLLATNELLDKKEITDEHNT